MLRTAERDLLEATTGSTPLPPPPLPPPPDRRAEGVAFVHGWGRESEPVRANGRRGVRGGKNRSFYEASYSREKLIPAHQCFKGLDIADSPIGPAARQQTLALGPAPTGPSRDSV